MVKLRRVFELELYLESKKDLDDLKDYLGDTLFDNYMKIRDKISDPNFKDFSKLKKMDKKDIQDFVSSFQSKSSKRKSDKTEGAKKLYEDSDWVVYRITTPQSAKLYGKGTKWCISGEGVFDDDGSRYFDKYIKERNLDGGYYFYLNKKDPSEKYCVLQTKQGKIDSIWDSKDRSVGSSVHSLFSVDLPDIPDVNLHRNNIDKLCFMLRNLPSSYDINLIEKEISSVDDLNKVDGLGELPLNIATIHGYKDIVEVLLRHGANPNSKDSDGKNSLFLLESVFKRSIHLDILCILVDHGADVNSIARYNKTPLMENIFSISVTSFLLEHGADPNKKDAFDNTALLLADHYYVVLDLLKYGADPNVINDMGETPLMKFSTNKRICSLLKEYGAKE